MKKLLSRTSAILIFLILSCSKEKDIENIFLAKETDYWRYENNCGSRGVYFKFNKNGTYDKFNRFIGGKFELFNTDGDLLSGTRIWSIKNDSTLIWDSQEYRIEKYFASEVLLSYYDSETEKKCNILLKIVSVH